MGEKRGTPFERVVAAVLQAVDPGASVNRGQWIVGPDGRRELDVLVRGVADGHERQVLVECKDFDPKATGRVGIEFIDALDSKRQDLHVDFAAICSNSGFTKGAISKAARVGIGLIGVMKEGDKRIRFSVTEETYLRKVDAKLTWEMQGPNAIDFNAVRAEDIRFEGAPIENWVAHRASLVVSHNPVVNGSFTSTNRLRQPLEFTVPSGSVVVSQVDFRLQLTGAWYALTSTLDATNAIYDWLRHRVRLGPGPGRFTMKGDSLDAAEFIERPPERELEGFRDIRRGEFCARMVLKSGFAIRQPVPNLDRHIRPDDLDVILHDLSPEAVTSVRV